LPIYGAGAKDQTSALHVERGRLVENGVPVTLHGVNVPSLESSNSGLHVFRSCRIALEDWKANCIRLPVCQDRWFGKAPDQHGNGENYRNAIDEIATYVSRSNAYLILDLHWSDEGTWGGNLGAHKMPDLNSGEFWKEASHRFRGNLKVIFDLYNTPHDVSWDIWRQGGLVYEDGLTYNAIGFERLVADVRGAGGKNVLMIAGVGESQDISKASALVDPNGNGLIFDYRLKLGAARWDVSSVEALAESYPIVLGELGEEEGSTRSALDLIQSASSSKVSWAAWSMQPGTPSSLISDWIYTPAIGWGSGVRDQLLKDGS
jgi:endoglucanase